MIAVDDARRHARQCTVHATELAPVLDAKCVRKGRAGRGGGISTAIPRHCATHPIPRHSARVPFGGGKKRRGRARCHGYVCGHASPHRHIHYLQLDFAAWCSGACVSTHCSRTAYYCYVTHQCLLPFVSAGYIIIMNENEWISSRTNCRLYSTPSVHKKLQ